MFTSIINDYVLDKLSLLWQNPCTIYFHKDQMSKQRENNEQRETDIIRNRILVIVMVAFGVLLVILALVLPTINIISSQVGKTRTIIAITPVTSRVIKSKVDGQHLGDSSALVKIDVWEDFQCSSCRFYSINIEPQIIQNYIETGKVYYTFHFYPLIDGGNTSGESHHSANAALCAADQGHFWDYHDILFTNWNGENQGSFSDEHLVAFAENLRLDMKSFNQCFQANSYANFIDQDMLAGKTAGVHGTPSVFVNGQLLTPGFIPSYDQISAAIDTALAGK
jgi:protein-disulfide isomerase